MYSSGWFKKFYKGEESLEDEELSGRPLEVDNSWEPSSKLILLELHKMLPKNLLSTVLQSFRFEANCKDAKAQ